MRERQSLCIGIRLINQPSEAVSCTIDKAMAGNLSVNRYQASLWHILFRDCCIMQAVEKLFINYIKQ